MKFYRNTVQLLKQHVAAVITRAGLRGLLVTLPTEHGPYHLLWHETHGFRVLKTKPFEDGWTSIRRFEITREEAQALRALEQQAWRNSGNGRLVKERPAQPGKYRRPANLEW